jgi:maltose O-acetyltransferase
VYFRFYDLARFFAQASRGYVTTQLTPARFGRFPNIRGRVKLHIRGEAVFGERFTALGEPLPVRIAVADGARLTIGDHVAINCGMSMDVWHDVRIGNKVMIAPNVTIVDDNRHEIEPGARLYSGPIVIEDNVWIAGNVTILSGVTIGSGAVIAAHSVVTRDIPPNCLAGGSPAKVIKSLNVPDGWSHRFGYERNDPADGLFASLRRAFAGDPNAGLASTAEAGRVVEPGRDHEVIRLRFYYVGLLLRRRAASAPVLLRRLGDGERVAGRVPDRHREAGQQQREDDPRLAQLRRRDLQRARQQVEFVHARRPQQRAAAVR